jgi:uncharacterized protein YcaQ
MASFVPMEMYSLFEFRRDDDWLWGSLEKVLRVQPGLPDEIEDRVRGEGPLRTGDLEDSGGRTGRWWGYSETKHVLEHLFGKGRLVTACRHHFTRYYDTPEKVLPASVFDQPRHTTDSSYRAPILSGAGAAGIGTAEDILDWWRLNKPTG